MPLPTIRTLVPMSATTQPTRLSICTLLSSVYYLSPARAVTAPKEKEKGTY